jgi:hypothetical protein
LTKKLFIIDAAPIVKFVLAARIIHESINVVVLALAA